MLSSYDATPTSSLTLSLPIAVIRETQYLVDGTPLLSISIRRRTPSPSVVHLVAAILDFLHFVEDALILGHHQYIYMQLVKFAEQIET